MMEIVQDEISAKHFLQVFIDFGHILGLTLNMTKTEAVWLGVNRNRTDKPLNIRWPALPIKVLGVYFSYDRELCEKRNFGDKIDKAKQIINMWKQRDLSLIGSVQIIKTFITSLFLYSISAVDIPETYIKEVESVIYAFVRKDKKEILKRRVLIKNKEEGGLKVPSFKFTVDSVKLKCFLQIFDSDSEQVWALLVRQYFKTNNLDLSAAIKCPELSTCTKNLIFPSLYTQTFQLWDEPCRKELFISFNPGININNTSFFWKRFFDIGILYICDLFEPDGSTIAFEQWLHKGLTHRDFLNWAGLVSCQRKTSIFLQNNFNTRTIESGLRFNNQEYLISEGKISQKIDYNGILELRNIVHVPRIERYS